MLFRPPNQSAGHVEAHQPRRYGHHPHARYNLTEAVKRLDNAAQKQPQSRPEYPR